MTVHRTAPRPAGGLQNATPARGSRGLTGGRRAEQRTAGWGHWVLLALILATLAAALFVQRVAAGAQLSPAALRPAALSPAAAGPVLLPQPGNPRAAGAAPRTISLTFDGGPGQDLTARFVSALARLRVHGTFFVLGNHVARQPSLVRLVRHADDELGMAVDTGVPTAQRPGWWLNAELAETQQELVRAGDPGTALVRPLGAGTVTALPATAWRAARRLRQLGYVVVLADRSAQNSTGPAAVLRALERAGAAPSSRSLVLAMADAGRPGAAALAALPELVHDLQSRGYRFTTVAQAFHLRFGPARLSLLSVAGERALLLTTPVSGVVVQVLGWVFLAAAILIALRLVLLVSTGGWHKLHARQPRAPWREPVSVVIPAYNEQAGIERSLRSILASDYPEIEVILVDDGSSDGTGALAVALGLPVVVVVQPNSGKAAALNTGVRHARHSVLIFADGDTMFEPTTISRLVAPFGDPQVGAVAGNIKVANRRRLLGLIQHAEYVVGSSLDRRMYDVLNCMVTIPGAAGAFRRAALDAAGGVPSNTLAEDTDLTIAIGKAGWRVRYAASARAWTEAPSSVRQLWSQRHRWAYGTLQALWKYRGMASSPRGRRQLAWIGLPYLFAMGCVLPLISPAADLYMLFHVWDAPWRAVGMWAGFVAMQGTLTVCAFAFDRERLRYMWTLPFQQVLYRQLMYLVVIHSLATACTGVRLRWHKLDRIGVGARAFAGDEPTAAR